MANNTGMAAPQSLSAARPALTREQLLALQANLRGGSAYSANGMDWTNNGFAGTGEDMVGAQAPTEYYATQPGHTGEVGPYSVYDMQGNYLRDGVTHPVDFEKSFAQWAAMAAAMAGGLGALGMVGAGGVGAGFGAGAGAGGLGGAGAGLSEMGLAGEGAFGATNALGGAGALGSEGAAYYGAGGGLLGGGGGYAPTALGSGSFDAGVGALTDAGISGSPYTAGLGAASAPLPMEAGGWAAATANTGSAGMSAAGLGGAAGGALGGAAGASGAGGGGGAAGGAGSALGGSGSWLGPAASLAGGLLGSQGSQNQNSTTQRMDPRMEALTYGDLFPRAQGLLAEQMDPARRAGYRTMQTGGQTLMNTPVAPNGTARFFGSNHLA